VSLVLLAFLLLLSSLPAVDGILAVAGVLVIASIPADPGVPILAGVFTYYTVQCTLYNRTNKGLSDYRTLGSKLLFFSAIVLLEYRISHWQQKNIGCPPLVKMCKLAYHVSGNIAEMQKKMVHFLKILGKLMHFSWT
jgi:hypothetical protein